MKRVICSICLALFLWMAFGSCDNRSVEVKIAHRIISNVIKKLNERYQLHCIAISEAGNKEYYKKIGLSFQIFHILSKEEGRRMLIDCTEELLREINSNSELQPYLLPYPFTVANVEMAIFVYDPDGKFTLYPDICIFSVFNGNVRYNTKIPEMKYGYYTEEVESYAEALEIVHSQAIPASN